MGGPNVGGGTGTPGSIASYMNNGMAAGSWFGVPSSGASGGGVTGGLTGPLNLTPGQSPTFTSGPGMPSVSANIPGLQQALGDVGSFMHLMYPSGIPLPFGGIPPAFHRRKA